MKVAKYGRGRIPPDPRIELLYARKDLTTVQAGYFAGSRTKLELNQALTRVQLLEDRLGIPREAPAMLNDFPAPPQWKNISEE